MNPSKRLVMATALIATLALIVSAPALAKPAKPDGGSTWGPIELTNVGDEPRASGEATLTEVVRGDVYYEQGLFYIESYRARLHVDCKNLTPGATYAVPAGTFTANSRGKATVEGDVYFEIVYIYTWSRTWQLSNPYWVDVVRLNPDGSAATVLTGMLAPPFPPLW
jgi:hypothetical protein